MANNLGIGGIFFESWQKKLRVSQVLISQENKLPILELKATVTTRKYPV
jgi:hypothetical protein